MSKVRLVFYKAKFPDGSIVDDLISWWTYLPNIGTPPYSHSEIGIEIDGVWCYFSSTTRNRVKDSKKSNGTRWINGNVLLKNTDRWDVYDYDADYVPDKILERADSCLGLKYDWLGIFGFLTPFSAINDKNKWYCSEVVNFVLTGVWKKRISPRKLYKVNKRLLKKVKL